MLREEIEKKTATLKAMDEKKARAAGGDTFYFQQGTLSATVPPPPPPGIATAAPGQVILFDKAADERQNARTEDLGQRAINGVVAKGRRTTITIPAGQIGNERPIEIVNETWYSPELQTTVMSKRSDPRFGDTTYELMNIERAEPDPMLFQVPSDYKIEESPERMFKMRVPPPPPPPTAK